MKRADVSASAIYEMLRPTESRNGFFPANQLDSITKLIFAHDSLNSSTTSRMALRSS
uniref:Uncharacterized protein n=1 Tax=Candidatus Kentrum sp. LFY TaxID=2126342 RepID=A0A450UWC8_9GAMM|nr:MAG: hypothetical protein BECKLFY1418A_GA0070994_106321 [Candidatus Kentron sp. LFY]